MSGFVRLGRGFKSRRGSASALIVLLLVLMVFFGVLSIVTAAADNRLAARRADWVKTYYKADRTAVEVLNELRQIAGDPSHAGDPEVIQAALEHMLEGRPDIEILSSGTGERAVTILIRVRSGKQGIEAGATFGVLDSGSEPVVMTVTRWTSWQEPFDDENTGGGIWKG